MHYVPHSHNYHASFIMIKLWLLDIVKNINPKHPLFLMGHCLTEVQWCTVYQMSFMKNWPKKTKQNKTKQNTQMLNHCLLWNLNFVRGKWSVHFLVSCSSATKWKLCPPSLAVDLCEPTFCHSPWVLATSDFLAVHLNDHVAAHHCQRHLLLEYGETNNFLFIV